MPDAQHTDVKLSNPRPVARKVYWIKKLLAWNLAEVNLLFHKLTDVFYKEYYITHQKLICSVVLWS